jgi:hypothetical protein
MVSLVDTEIVLACRCHYKYDNCDLTAIGSSFFFFLFKILSSCQGSMVLVVVQSVSEKFLKFLRLFAYVFKRA